MQLDEQIRDALASEARAIPADAIEYLRRIDYRPRRRAISPTLAAGVTGTAAAVAGVLVALGGADTQAAFAGWSATPTIPSAGQVSAVEATCAARLSGVSKNGVSASTVPVLANTRGP